MTDLLLVRFTCCTHINVEEEVEGLKDELQFMQQQHYLQDADARQDDKKLMLLSDMNDRRGTGRGKTSNHLAWVVTGTHKPLIRSTVLQGEAETSSNSGFLGNLSHLGGVFVNKSLEPRSTNFPPMRPLSNRGGVVKKSTINPPLTNLSPYKTFKEKMAIEHPGCFWSDTEQYLCSLFDLPLELPGADAVIAFTYYPAWVSYSMKGDGDDLLTPPNPRTEVTLHGVWGVDKTMHIQAAIGAYGAFLCTEELSFSEDLLEKLNEIAPAFTNTGNIKRHPRGTVYKELAGKIVRHLRELPFLTPDTYWSFGIQVYETFQMGSLMRYISDECANKLAGDNVPSGWWGIRACELVRLAHQYPPLRTRNAVVSFRFFQNNHGWFMKDLLLSVTKDGDAAKPARNVIIFDNVVMRAEDFPFDEVVLMREREVEQDP